MEWWGTLLISIASTVAGGIITGLFTIYIERRKQKRLDQEKRKEELQKQYELRPRLELKKYKDLKQGKIESKADLECLLLHIKDKKPSGESFFFIYDEKALNKKELSCVEYEFVNTGKTEIDSICVVSNQPKNISNTELESREFIIKNGLLRYEAWSKKRFIKPGETTSIKICYVKGCEISSFLSATIAIYMEDINGNIWHQPLFCPSDEMENSYRDSRKTFNDARDIRAAIECFKNPLLW